MIRNATVADAKAIARVHVDSWKEAYSGILPQASLDDLGYRGRENMWKGLDPARTFVAEEDGDLVGFTSVGPERSADATYTGEVYTLYVRRAWQRRGIGRALLLRGVGALAADGHDGILLWVLHDNQAARGFYEAMGATRLRRQSLTIFGERFEEDAYGWVGLDRLLG